MFRTRSRYASIPAGHEPTPGDREHDVEVGTDEPGGQVGDEPVEVVPADDVALGGGGHVHLARIRPSPRGPRAATDQLEMWSAQRCAGS